MTQLLADTQEQIDDDKLRNVNFYNWIYLISTIVSGCISVVQMYVSIKFLK